MFHILKVCVKHWRCCCGVCADFEPVTPTKDAVASLDCRFKRKVYLSTEEFKFLVKRTKGKFPREVKTRLYEREPKVQAKGD